MGLAPRHCFQVWVAAGGCVATSADSLRILLIILTRISVVIVVAAGLVSSYCES
jgi:hypothetical protein